MTHRLKTLLLAALICATVGACSSPRYWGESEEMPLPVGVGPEPSDLKRSPCACMEVPQVYSDPTA
jgi:hypothetical protein